MDPEPSQESALSPELSLRPRACFEHLSSLTGSPTRDLTQGFLDGLTSLRPLSLPARDLERHEAGRGHSHRQVKVGVPTPGEAEACDSPENLNGFS